MKRISMVIIEHDEMYLEPLEIKFLEGLGEYGDIQIITSDEYLEEFCHMPHQIDVLIINENKLSEKIIKQNPKLVFVLREEDEIEDTSNINNVYKYSSVKEIYHKIIGKVNEIFNISVGTNESGVTNAIMIYSPIGGCGKTTTALGICTALAKLNKKVLYVNLENIQNFQYMLKNNEAINNGFERHLSIKDEKILTYFKGTVRNEMFDYLPPMRGSTSSYGIKDEDYLYFIHKLLATKMYEYIVFDVSNEINMFKAKLMNLCQKNVIVLNQDLMSVFKVEKFLENIDYSDGNKFLFLCNKYREQNDNYIHRSNMLNQVDIVEYVAYDEIFEQTASIYALDKNKMFQATAYLML